LPPCCLGLRDLHPAHTRLVQPSVRTAGSKPAILEAHVRRRTEKTPLRTPAVAKRVEPSEASAQNLIEASRQTEGDHLAEVALPISRILSSVQHEADGCASPASSTGPRRAERGPRGASLAVSSPKLGCEKWALRPPSRAQRRQRRPYGRAPPTIVKASRFELSNPGLRGPNAKRAPGRPVCP
jgi:hypothetical protein